MKQLVRKKRLLFTVIWSKKIQKYREKVVYSSILSNIWKNIIKSVKCRKSEVSKKLLQGLNNLESCGFYKQKLW